MMIPGIVAQRRAAGGAPVLWTPLNMATVPQIYLDAQDSVVTDVLGFASAISNLGAMGSDGDFSQATAGNRPSILAAELNGKRILRFDGADDCIKCASAAGLALFRNVPAAWAFTVHKKRGLDGSPTNRIFFYSLDGAGGYRFLLINGNATAGRVNKPSMFAKRLDAHSPAGLDSPNVVQGAYCLSLSSINFSTREAVLRENGSVAASTATLTVDTGNTSNTSSPSMAIGAFHTGVASTDVDLAAIVIGNVQPSAGEFEKMEGWAAHKYGLTANLPSGHPYKTVAPTV
ncbi:hypothetical protein [Pseudomonas phage Rollin]|nr:hypothetical protein [Pseudomonas phage Rollin]